MNKGIINTGHKVWYLIKCKITTPSMLASICERFALVAPPLQHVTDDPGEIPTPSSYQSFHDTTSGGGLRGSVACQVVVLVAAIGCQWKYQEMLQWWMVFRFYAMQLGNPTPSGAPVHLISSEILQLNLVFQRRGSHPDSVVDVEFLCGGRPMLVHLQLQ